MFAFRTATGRIVEEHIAPVSAETPLPAVAPSEWGRDGSSMDGSFAVGELQRGRCGNTAHPHATA